MGISWIKLYSDAGIANLDFGEEARRISE